MNSFDYPLLSDESGDVARSFGVKRKYITPVKRATFVIDRDRTIRKVDHQRDEHDRARGPGARGAEGPVADWGPCSSSMSPDPATT